ncbi:MAG: PPC domain-containing protein [Isosphaeraceae bacterium]|nr:PPC domain-containing protein [Isosphaeraceae bacterium]
MKRRHRSPGVEFLEGRQLLSVVVAERENNDRASRANVIAFDVDNIAQLQGASLNRTDRDFFTFTAPASGNLNVAVRSRNGVFAQLEVQNQAGTGLLETQRKNGINAGSVAITAGQSYLVRLRSPVNARAAYSVDLLIGGAPGNGGSTANPPPVAVVGESRNDDRIGRANAVTLRAGEVVQLQGSVTRRDRDFYSFTAPSAGTLGIDARTANGVLAKVEVKDSAGVQLFETEPNDGVNTGSVALEAGRTYFVEIRSAINRVTSSYLVDLLFGATGTGGGSGGTGGGGTVPVGTVVESESNDSKGAADPFDLGIVGSARLQGTSTGQDDRDFFVFTPTQSGFLNAVVGSTNGVFAQLEVEDILGGTLFETEPNDGRNTGRAAVVAGRTYFVRLRSKVDGPAAYLVDLLFDGSLVGGGGGSGGGGTDDGDGSVGGTFAESESNGEKSAADPFSFNVASPAVLTGTSADRDDRDFFTFTASRTGTVTVALASTGGSLADLEVENAAGANLLALEDGRTGGSFAVSAGTVYFVRLRAPEDSAASYRVDFTLA